MEKWTENEIKILKENYSNNGLAYVQNLINKSKSSISWKISSLKLKVDPILKGKRVSKTKLEKIKDFDKYKVNPKQFFDINTIELAYILGIIWADGNIRKNIISLTLKKEDGEKLKEFFSKTGIWNIYYRIPPNRKEQITFYTHNKVIFNFLVENDFLNKSYVSPNKILNLIPEHLKSYFYRGYFDGDGTIYIGHKQNLLNITSRYEQDWSIMEELFSFLNIKYSVSRLSYLNKNGIKNSLSRIVIQNRIGIIIFCDYIYNNFENDNIGFKRKYDIYKKMKENENIFLSNRK